MDYMHFSAQLSHSTGTPNGAKLSLRYACESLSTETREAAEMHMSILSSEYDKHY